MITTLTPAQIPLEDVVGQILLSGKITTPSRYQLMRAFLADSLSEGEYIMLDRLFYGVRKGLLLVVD